MKSPEGITFLHHVGLFVSDFDSTIACYQNLGFHFAPFSNVKFALKPGAEPVPIGAAKRDAVFEKGFLEVVGINNTEAWGQTPQEIRDRFDIAARISRYEGIHVMFMGTSDIEAVHARLLSAGLPTSDIGSMSRNIDRPDGQQTLTAKFIHAGPVLFAQFANPEALFHPSFQTHPNGAAGLTGCIMCVSEPAEQAASFACYTGLEVQKRGDVHLLELGQSRIMFVSPEHVGQLIRGFKPPVLPVFAGFTVSTGNMESTREFLSGRNVPYDEYDGWLIVNADCASGCAVIFEEAGHRLGG